MKTRRHSKILELIQQHNIDTQEELLKLLRAEGYDVTQATVSRDIKELRLVKPWLMMENINILPAKVSLLIFH